MSTKTNSKFVNIKINLSSCKCSYLDCFFYLTQQIRFFIARDILFSIGDIKSNLQFSDWKRIYLFLLYICANAVISELTALQSLCKNNTLTQSPGCSLFYFQFFFLFLSNISKCFHICVYFSCEIRASQTNVHRHKLHKYIHDILSFKPWSTKWLNAPEHLIHSGFRADYLVFSGHHEQRGCP